MKFIKRVLPVALIVAAVGAPEARAEVGKTYLTAYSRSKGTQVKAGKYGTQILLRTKSQNSTTRTTKSGKKVPVAAYKEKVTFCKRTYYTTERGKRWIAAHRRAKHVLVVRYHQAKGKYRPICGTVPKKQSTTKKKSS